MDQISDYFYNQSGAIPYKVINNEIYILIITSRKKHRWIFPKGISEPELTPQQSAINEAFEEAGVQGVISDIAVGEYTFLKWGGTCNVTLYPLQVTEEFQEWPESDFRERKWIPLSELNSFIEIDGLKLMLDKFEKIVEKTNAYKKL